jgi:hypothetical protein
LTTNLLLPPLHWAGIIVISTVVAIIAAIALRLLNIKEMLALIKKNNTENNE